MTEDKKNKKDTEASKSEGSDKAEKAKESAQKKQDSSSKQLIVIRIRGAPKMNNEVERVLEQMHLGRKHHAVIMPDNAESRGRIKKVQAYVAWDVLTPEIKSDLDKLGEGPYYRLSPPKGGYPRKGIKMPFGRGGSLGNWRGNINKLVKRMVA